MFTLTFITPSGKLETISSPRRSVVLRLFRVLRLQGTAARVWFNGSSLVF
jgi:hypothetical protein